MSEPAPYRVLARKYRPANFVELIGQDAMVRTLTNAFEQGRIAHAFILTGVRGVGKTTTARIVARALNCVGPDGRGGPTIQPCGACENCLQIAADRHVDVLEMDAASRTGIEDIREIIDSVRYAPAMARFKVFIIDEVHMLSTAAFNGLLKTLEEPPPHVKFIFATTDIRKVPVTVLSRCQRFDLRRIEPDAMIAYLGDVARRENVAVAPEALSLLARAAEGSMRDGLSLLDQAIAHGGGSVEAAQVHDMLGLADRTQMFDLFEQAMKGDARAALATLGRQYDSGADPAVVLQDLLELAHWLTRIKIAPDAADDPTVAEAERERARALATALGMPALSRAWQLLLKGLGELRETSKPILAAEMTLIRLAHVSELPTPADLVKQLSQGGTRPTAGPNGAGSGNAPTPAPATRAVATQSAAGGTATAARIPQAMAAEPAAAPAETRPTLALAAFTDLVELAGAKRDLKLKAALTNFLHLVRFEPGRLEFRPANGAPADLAQELSRKLADWTGQRWVVSVSREAGAPTLRQQGDAAASERLSQIERHPTVQAVLNAFPGATIRAVRDLGDSGAPAGADPADADITPDDDGAGPKTDEGDFHP